jgi:hypothetical protein
MLLSASVSAKTPIRKAEFYDSKMLVNCGFDFCRSVRVPGGAGFFGFIQLYCWR